VRLSELRAAVRMMLSRAAGLNFGSMAAALSGSGGSGYRPVGKSKRRGCGTGDHHRLWLNTDGCGVICATVVWVLALYSYYVFTVSRAAEEGRL
jgi:hypothetical protein